VFEALEDQDNEYSVCELCRLRGKNKTLNIILIYLKSDFGNVENGDGYKEY
jgi:hypothetical protein